MLGTSGSSENLQSALLPAAGVSLKAEHYRDILDQSPDVGWFELHPENYMGDGGAPHAYLTAIRERYPLSLHGVGLSLGGSLPLNQDHLRRFRALIDRYDPVLVSEHLAWSTHQAGFYNDLLALPYTPETLALVSDHVDQTQEALGRQILIENPATYVTFEQSSLEEIAFLTALADRTGCGLLLDCNNVFVSCTNHGRDAIAYLDRFPMDRVGEIHLAGHAEDAVKGPQLLIDAHDRPVAEPVWDLYSHALSKCGPAPTLVEWDNALPDWPVFYAEVQRTRAVMRDSLEKREAGRHVA